MLKVKIPNKQKESFLVFFLEPTLASTLAATCRRARCSYLLSTVERIVHALHSHRSYSGMLDRVIVGRPPCTEELLSYGGRWAHEPQLGFTYHPHRCELKRHSAADVRRCLQGRHLLFFGDSISRYLYLLLARLLVVGEWPDDASLLRGNSTCHEASWYDNWSGTLRAKGLIPFERDHWRNYFTGTNAELNGHELCDCYREWCCEEAHLTENRFFRSRGVQLSYVTQITRPSWQPHGHVVPGTHAEMRAALKCAPGECAAPSAWRFDSVEFMSEGLSALQVTDAILSTGHHWRPSQAPDGYLKRLLLSAASNRSRRVWWRLPSASRDDIKRQRTDPDEAMMRRLAKQLPVWVIDTNMPTLALETLPQWGGAFVEGDRAHFVCSIYRELHMLLLSSICT